MLLTAFVEVVVQAAIYILFGLMLAATLKALIPSSLVLRFTGQTNFKSVLGATLAGIPMPLCSCGVIPMAVALRQQGASPGAVMAFLIATPETGVDSILLSFALLNPLMAIVRPVVALLTALTTGVIENINNPVLMVNTKLIEDSKRPNIIVAFMDLLANITPWLLTGLALSALINIYVPASFIEQHLSNGVWAKLLMLAIGLPMYICASASTPVAASLMLKGMSPGTALVFLLAGPATNVTTMLTVLKLFGRRSLAIYLGTIAVFSLVFGLLLDWYVIHYGIEMVANLGIAHHHGEGLLAQLGAVVLLVLMAISLMLRA